MGVLTILLVAAFAIDRIVAGLFFLLSFSSDLRPLLTEDPEYPNAHAARVRRLIYAMVAGYLGVVVIAGILNVHLFDMAAPVDLTSTPGSATNTFQVIHPSRLLDTLLTGMILAAGADRLSDIVKSFGAGAETTTKSEEKPLEITGRLILERPGVKAADPLGDMRAEE